MRTQSLLHEQLSVRFDIETFKEMEKLAARERRPVAWMIREACAVFVKQQQRAGRKNERPTA